MYFFLFTFLFSYCILLSRQTNRKDNNNEFILF
nr:MAG TPA_asm: hypothetical protein [Caudoviricetes sp.]